MHYFIFKILSKSYYNYKSEQAQQLELSSYGFSNMLRRAYFHHSHHSLGEAMFAWLAK